jgi:hypothetical protein
MSPIITNGNFAATTAWTPIAVTGEADTEVFSASAHGLLDGQEVALYGLTGGTGIAAGIFYVRDKATNTFKLATVRGGTASAFSTDITAGYVVRTGPGIPTGWTISKSVSSEVVGGAEDSLSPADMPSNTYVEIKVNATPGAASALQNITLVPQTLYRMSLDASWAHEDPAEVTPAHAPTIALYSTTDKSLKSDGTWQDNGSATIAIPMQVAKGGRLALVFRTPETLTAYTVKLDKGTMDGTDAGIGYLEIARITNLCIEPVPWTLFSERPENDATVRAALPENS